MPVRVNNLLEMSKVTELGKSKPIEVSVPLNRGDVVLLRGMYYRVDGTFKDTLGKLNLRLFCPTDYQSFRAWAVKHPEQVKPIGTQFAHWG